MKKVNYRLPDTGKTAPAFILCQNGEAILGDNDERLRELGDK